jgi:hypothetical protein
MHCGGAATMLAALLAIAPVKDATPPMAVFAVGTVNLEIPIPAGYCLPTGDIAAVAQVVAASDDVNVTDLTLVRCGVGSQAALEDYMIIKTPKRALVDTVTREQLLVAVGAEFDRPEFKDFIAKGVGAQAENQWKNMGVEIHFSGTPQPLGRDNVCAYLGGQLSPSDKDGKIYPTLMGGCLTSVGGKVVSVFRYVAPGKGKEVGDLLREVRALAVQIRVAPVK